jgi:hypothetical protein
LKINSGWQIHTCHTEQQTKTPSAGASGQATTMNWYLAKIVFRIVCGDGNHTAQFDEQLRLIKADKKEEALLKAQLLGSREEEMFFTENQRLIHWQFVNVSELYKISELIDGAELYSRIEEKENGECYVQLVNEKAALIESGNTLELLELV